MKILFWLNTGKKNKQGKHPIYCRITINGERAEISTGIFVLKSEYDTKKKQIKHIHPLAESYNKHIESIAHNLSHFYYKQVFAGEIPPTASELKAHIKDEKELEQRKITNLVPVLQDYADDHYRIKQNGNINARHLRFIEIISRYLSVQNKPHLNIDRCNTRFFDEIAHYWHNDKHYSPAYIKKLIGFIRAALRHAYNKGYTHKLPPDYTVPFRQSNDIVYLSEREIDKLSVHRFAEERLQRVADCFLVQCYTGLAYADLKKLNATNIAIEKDGLWLNVRRQKVQTAEMTVPVLKNVKELLLKYNFMLPVISNQKYNAALKEIAKEVGIHKNITSHVGRKTFGTLLLNKDVPIETVSRLLGHSDIKITQKHYAKVLHMKIAKDLRLLF